MPIDSLVSPVGYVSREICLSQGSGLPEGPYVRCYLKVAPFLSLINSQFPPPSEVSLSILELGRGELPFAHLLPWLLVTMGRKHPQCLGFHTQY
jgi:hypothetical protein